MDLAAVDARVAAVGLVRIGQFALDGAETARLGCVSGVMVGNGPQAMWHAFRRDVVAGRVPSGPDPLDRWIRAVVAPIAADFDALAVFPFEGPPYHPFVTWAQRTGRVHASPLGLGIHDQLGLWHGLRAALLVDAALPLAPPTPSPCATCADRPCLSACPVSAFRPQTGFKAATCRRHLTRPDAACPTVGCLARHACPVGTPYGPDQAAFHMRAFSAWPGPQQGVGRR